MRWLKRDRWKAGIALAGLLLLLALWLLVAVMWFPVSANAYERRSGFAGPGTVTLQTPSAEDLTVTAVALDIQKQNDVKLQRDNSGIWPWLNAGSIGTICLALAAVIGTIIGFRQWRGNREDERKKEIAAQDKELRDREDARRKELETQDKDLRAQAEERFKAAVTALGDENEGTQVGGAILLRSFLNKDDEKIYGRYYTQIFDLAVAYLRLSSTSQPSEDSNTPLPLTPLRQALIVVFREAFPLARDRLKEQEPKTKFNSQSLDASHVKLDNAYLAKADLKQAWMPNASLRGASLEGADFTEANLTDADFREAQFRFTIFTKANLEGANLSGIFPSRSVIFRFAKLNNADLHDANLSRHAVFYNAELNGANLARAILTGADLTVADFSGADLSGADLSRAMFQEQGANYVILGTKFRGANLSEANFSGVDMRGVYLNDAILRDTKMHNVRGVTKEQIDDFEAREAIVDKTTRTNASQPTAAPAAQSTDAQIPTTTPAQVNTPPPSTDGSSSTSAQPNTEP